MVTLTYADPEAAVRAWAREHPGLVAVLAHRTFFVLPKDFDLVAKGNALSLSLVGGAPDPDTPLDASEIQFSCWGKTKGDAAAVRTALISALHSMGRVVVAIDETTNALLSGARVTGSFYRPDLSADPVFPRYVVTAAVAVLPSS